MFVGWNCVCVYLEMRERERRLDEVEIEPGSATN